MRHLIFSFIILLFVSCSKEESEPKVEPIPETIPTPAATTPTIQWQKCLGGSLSDESGDVQQTSDGGYIVSGIARSSDGDVSVQNGNGDLWVVKLNNNSNIVWEKSLGTFGSDFGSSIEQTVDGGYIVCGSVNGDIGVYKLTSSGSLSWQQILGGSMNEYGNSIQQTVDGGYIITGASWSNDGDVSGNHGNADIWVVKLNSSGGIVWQKCIGGTGREDGNSIRQTTDGGYVLVGSSFSNDGDFPTNSGNSDIWVIKLTNTGAITWKESIGYVGYDYGNFIQQTSDGGYIIAGGVKRATNMSSEMAVFKLTNTGGVSWEKYWVSSYSYGQPLSSVQETIDGGYIVCADVNNPIKSDCYLAKLNSSGGINWDMVLGGNEKDYARKIRQTTDGGYVVTGITWSNDGDVSGNHGNADIWVVKLSP